MDKSLEVGGMSIENLIYEIRGKQVMLDSDLARLYECKNGTKVINQAVRRNAERFPEDFYFQLTEEEFLNLKSQLGTSSLKGENNLKSQFVTSSSENDIILRSQIVTANNDGHGGVRKIPYAFTEQGVAMLATVLRTDIAAQMSVSIMRAFVAMRRYISANLLEQKYINNLVLEDHDGIELLESSFQKFEEKKVVNEVYFNGQIYDAYSKILEIFNEAKEQLIIIDMYADKTILDIVKRLKIDVTIITKPNNLLMKQDIKKYSAQYNNLRVIYNTTFHDRYFILDGETLYHCGASVNRIGYKTFSINKIEDEDAKTSLINKVKTLILA